MKVGLKDKREPFGIYILPQLKAALERSLEGISYSR